MRETTIYCLKRKSNGEYVELNRDYGPLGSKGWRNPEDIPGVKYDIGPEDAADISHNYDPDTRVIYLFSDLSAPWLSDEAIEFHQERLEALRARRVVS